MTGMEAVMTALTLVVIAMLWVAAVAFGSDSRQGGDWSSSPSERDRAHRLGD